MKCDKCGHDSTYDPHSEIINELREIKSLLTKC